MTPDTDTDLALLAELDRAHSAVRDDLGRANMTALGIAGTVATLAAVGLAALMAGQWTPTRLPAAAQAVWWTAVLAAVTGMALLAAAVVPRMAPATAGPPVSWGPIAAHPAAEQRLPLLLDTPAAVRWVSAEPLLGPVDLTRWLLPPARLCGPRPPSPGDLAVVRQALAELGARRGLDWVVAGGESGPDHRPVHPDWVRSLRDQCTAAGSVPFLFKQWGGRTPKAGGRDLDGRTWDQTPDR